MKGFEARRMLMIVGLVCTLFTAPVLFIPVTVEAASPEFRARHQYDNWNWQHNWAYQAPAFRFETTYPVNQWGRPTTSDVSADRPQNIRRDRHVSQLPPEMGTLSGEFDTRQVNPFVTSERNTSRATGVESPRYGLVPGDTGLNVRAVSDGNNNAGFMANTSVQTGGGGVIPGSPGLLPQAGSVNFPPGSLGGGASFDGVDGNSQQVSAGPVPGFTVTHRPIGGSGNAVSNPTGTQTGRVTSVTPFNDGTIGRLYIPALGMEQRIRSGIDMRTLDNYIGHFPQSSEWDGNVAFASHNRGRGSYFNGIWNLNNGDRIIYETTLGRRTYEITSITRIHADDTENLAHSHENILTLVTCVEGQRDMRWSVRARLVS